MEMALLKEQGKGEQKRKIHMMLVLLVQKNF